MMWPYLRAAFPYAVVAFVFSVAGYSGEVMRGAFAGVPKGELEAARAMGMSPFTVLWRIWLPRALQNVFPTLAGEMVLTLKVNAACGNNHHSGIVWRRDPDPAGHVPGL